MHWPLVRIRHIARLNPSKSEVGDLDRQLSVSFLPMEAIGEDGSISLEHEKPISAVESGYTYFRNEDVAIAKITPCFENGKGAIMRGLTNNIGFGTTELIVVRPDRLKATSEYLQWLFVSTYFRRMGEAAMYGAGGQKRVPDDFVRNFRVALPPLSEQRSISSFLDTETAKIDTLVAEQRRLIELLKEKRQAVISHAVTKGLNPDAPMKPSGIEWLGNVPEHWRVVKVRRIFNVVKDIAGELGHQVLSITQQGIRIKDLDGNKGQYSMDYRKYQRVMPGDFAMNHMDLLTGYIDIADEPGVTSPDYRVFRLKDSQEAIARYFLRIFQTGYHNKIFFAYGQGSAQLGRWRLPTKQFKDFSLPVPPLEEQSAIVHHIDEQLDKLNSLRTESESAVELLNERRSALISAAVTGKIDVRNYQPDQAA